MAQKILSHMTMSLDGYIATPKDGVEHIFDWAGAPATFPCRPPTPMCPSSSTRPVLK